MAHRYLALPFPADIAAFDGRVAWIRSHMGTYAAALEVDTGVVKHLLTVNAGSTDGSIMPIADTIVVGPDVEVFEIATGATIRTIAGALCGTTARGSVVVVRGNETSGARLIVEAGGATERTLYRPAAPTTDLEALLVGDTVWTIDRGRLLGLPLEHGAARTELSVPGNTSLVPWGDTVLVVEDVAGREGIRSRVHAIDGASLRELATIDGEVDPRCSVATRDLLIASLVDREACALVDLTSGAEIARIEAPHRCAASRDTAAIGHPGALTVVTRSDGEYRAQRIALPSAGVPAAVVGARSIVATALAQMFVIELDELAWRDVDVTFAPVAPPRVGDPVPAKVVFAGASLVATDHPRLGRVTVKRASSEPALAKGDLIVLDELRETAPGKLAVVAWHKHGEPPAATELEPLLSRPSEIPHPRPHEEQASETRLPTLRAVARRLDFAIPPVLETLLDLHDRDPRFRRLLHRISILIEVTGGTTTWSGSDPCMLGFAGNGGGDVVALYYYPPAHTPGAELPIVEWMHEENTVEWIAPSFEDYLTSYLRGAESWAGSVVQAIRARLELPTGSDRKTKAPPWFDAAHGTKRRGRDADDLARERTLVRALRDHPEDRDAKSALLQIYERLGWSWHVEQVLAAEE